MKKSILAFAALAVFTGAAMADGLSANVSVVSKYKYRGQDQSDPLKSAVPAIQGGFDYAHASGFYAGNWNSNVSGVSYPNGASLEMDFYAGYKTEVAGVGLDVEVQRRPVEQPLGQRFIDLALQTQNNQLRMLGYLVTMRQRLALHDVYEKTGRSGSMPFVVLRVGLGEGLGDEFQGDAAPQGHQRARPEGRVGVRLRGDRPEPGLGEGDDAADGQKLRRGGDS